MEAYCSCLPSKVKRSESGGVAWRRKSGSKAKQPSRRSSTPPNVRPTLLLPPMRCTTTEENGTTAPVVTTRVQQSEGTQIRDGFLSLDNSPRCHPLPAPSAPSPGHLFYNSEDHSDIAFIVGREEWRFPAHSFILQKSQPTLNALLRTATGGTEDLDIRLAAPPDGAVSTPLESPIVLKLPDMQPDVFEQILRYLYTGQVSFSSVDSTLRLLHPCQVYHLPQLASRCLGQISQHVDPSNVLAVLSHLLCPDVIADDNSCCHDNDNERNELVFKCFLIVDRHADQILQSEHFETLEHELMVEIVKRDSLEVSSEAVVFDSVMRWACRACKRQRKELTADNKCSVLGKALFLVRYLVMTPEEFLRGPVSQGVLCREDKELFLARLTATDIIASPSPLPDRWNGWKIGVRRQRCPSLLPAVTSPHSELPSCTATETSVSPSNSVQPVNSNANKRNDRKKKSMSKKLLNGVGDLVICVIQLLD